MLISQMDFQMQYLLSMTNEAKMTRLNDARMNGSYSYFVKFIPINGIERIIVHNLRKICPVERIADGLQPGMSLKTDSKVFMDFPLENMKLKMHCRKGWQGGQRIQRLFMRK